MAFSSLATSFTATQSPTLGSFELDPRASWRQWPVTCARSSASAVQTRKKCLSSTATRAGTRPLALVGRELLVEVSIPAQLRQVHSGVLIESFMAYGRFFTVILGGGAGARLGLHCLGGGA